MKIKIYSIVLLAAALLAGACSNKNDKNTSGPEKNGKDEKAVFLKIKTNFGGATRSEEPTATGTSAVLYSALVYFLDGTDVIHEVFTIGQGLDVSVAELEAGYKFEGISSNVTQVYVVGNFNSVDSENDSPAFPMDEGQTLTDIQNVVWNIEQVSHGAIAGGITTGNLITVMDGQATILEYNGNETGWNGDETLGADDLYANVVLRPIVARIEIEQIEYTGDYLAFTLNGIFINNYYAEMPLSLDRDGLAPINNGSTVAYYTFGDPDFQYNYFMTLYDLPTETVTPDGSAVFTPGAGDVWAYQVFGNSNPVPHIILRLTGVTTAGGNMVGDRYVTVNGFMGPSGEVTTLERNTIYKIVSLEFNNDDTELVPEPETISVWVHVEIEPWETVIVTPII